MWPRAKLKFVARFGYGDALPRDEPLDGIFRVFGSNGPFASYSRANTGAPAIIIGRKGSYGKVNWTEKPCFASDTTFFIDESTSLNHLRWIYWLLQTLRLDEGTDEAAIPGLNRETAYSKDVLVPPPSQQRAIADYLDRETARLDALVAEKERLLDLLAEKRRSLITRAVTRGLDPNVPLRDSGISWLGEIPVHWTRSHLKRLLASMDYGISVSVETLGNVAVLRMGDIKDGEIDYSRIGFVDEVDGSLLLQPGDLVFNRTNSLDQIGKVALFRGKPDYPVSFASYLVRFRCSPAVLPEFLNWLLNSAYPLAWGRAQALPAIGQVNLNPNRYGYLPISLPSIEEQKEIVQYISNWTSRIDAVRTETRRTIELLEQRRAALISAAVTGQLEVT